MTGDRAGRGFVRAEITRSLGPFLAGYPGVSGDQLLRRAGIGPAQLADPDALLSLKLCIELLESAAAETGDPAFGVRWAEQLPLGDLGVLGYVLLHSPTIGSALANGCRYFAVQQTSGGTTLAVEGTHARLTYAVDTALGPHGQDSELVLALYVRIIRDGTANPRWAPTEVCFAHRRPASIAAQERFFQAPVRYGEPEDVLVLPAVELRVPLHTADSGLLPILLRHATECLARLPAEDDFCSDVQRVLISAMSSGEVAIDHVATALGMSPRSVQRRLQDTGRSFTQLVADTRLELSRRYLEDPAISLTEAAFLLGYSDLSAFSRAFRRWTGSTALEFRRRAPAARAR